MSKEKEYPDNRIQLRKCFNCKNNITCWHLTDNIPEGKDSKKMKMNQFGLLKHFLKAWGQRKLKTGLDLEYYSIRTILNTINPELSKDKDLSHNYACQVIAVLEIMANSSGKNWCCPGEEEGNQESFKYDPIRNLNEDHTKLIQPLITHPA
jgi:hypothetical protein